MADACPARAARSRDQFARAFARRTSTKHRGRLGATRSELYRDGERRNCFPELSSVRAGKHIRQDDGRFTRTDQHIVEAALAFSDPPARGSICSSVAMTLLWPTGPRLKLPGDEARYAATLESLFVCPTVNGASSETRTV